MKKDLGDFINAGVAQSVELPVEDRRVTGSIPVSSTISLKLKNIYRPVVAIGKTLVSKTRVLGSFPSGPAIHYLWPFHFFHRQ